MSCIFFYTFQALSDVDEVYRIPSTGQRFYHEEKLTYSKVFIGQLLSTSNLPCTGKQLCSILAGIVKITKCLVYKYRLLMRGIVENYCFRGKIQPWPTIHLSP